MLALREAETRFDLAISDPPYGIGLKANWQDVANVSRWLEELDVLEHLTPVVYWWGGIGKPGNRPFFDFIRRLEVETAWRMYDLITWRKRRAYGCSDRYLFIREEIAVLTLGGVPPPVFNIPLLDKKRGYAGFNKDHPAKSEFLRRGNVWDDVTELLRGKLHAAHKAPRVCSIPIEVHTNPGGSVLDLYAGSGEVAVQAKLLGRSSFSVESDADMCNAIRERLR